MTRLPERLPAALSERLASATQAIYSRQGREVDVAVGGIPFRLATFSELPQGIETIPIRKDQFDAEADPGEQSINGWWWRRSQSSWHEGAGNLYQESSERTIADAGFYDAEGIDVFTQGRITLLKRMDTQGSPFTGGDHLRAYRDNFGVDKVSMIANGDLYTGDYGTTPTALFTAASGSLVDGLVSYDTFYAVDANPGNLYRGNVSTPGTFDYWPIGLSLGVRRMGWGKHRLWIISGRSITNPDLSLASGTGQAILFTHPNAGWRYTCMAEGPSAMYFGGHDGYASSIQAVTFDAGGGIPAISGAAETAVLPPGELVQQIATVAGQFIGIGTNRGFRMGVIGSNGTITYGPLLVQPEGVTDCTSINVQDRFFVVGFNTADNRALAYRFDTSNALADGVYPYAKDILCSSGNTIISLVANGSRMGALTEDGQLWYQSTTNYVSTGFLQTGRVRYRTSELKLFRYISIEHEPLNGAIQVDLIKEGGSTVPITNLTLVGQTTSDPLAINDEPVRYSSVKLTLTPNGAGTAAPVVNSYLLRALPVIAPQRMITLQLLCFDQEQAKSGQRYGGKGYARDRLEAMTLLEDAALPVVYQDFSSSSSTGRIVSIESVRFTQSAPASAHRADGAGGILTLQLRTVDA